MRALLVALVERFSEQAMNAIDEANAPGAMGRRRGWLDRVEHAIRSVVELMLGRAAPIRAIFVSTERQLVDELRRIGTHLTIRLTRPLNRLPTRRTHDVGFAVLSAIAIASRNHGRRPRVERHRARTRRHREERCQHGGRVRRELPPVPLIGAFAPAPRPW